jgi:hypothetical protein
LFVAVLRDRFVGELGGGVVDHLAHLGEGGLGLVAGRGEAGELDEVAGLQEADELDRLERGDLGGGLLEGAAQLVGGAVEGVDAEAALDVALGDLGELQVVVLVGAAATSSAFCSSSSCW